MSGAGPATTAGRRSFASSSRPTVGPSSAGPRPVVAHGCAAHRFTTVPAMLDGRRAVERAFDRAFRRALPTGALDTIAARRQTAGLTAAGQTKKGGMTPMAKNMRVHELAKELGMTNEEVVDLARTLGVPVKSHSSSLNEAYADMVRRRAVRDGLTRPEQPEEPKPAKKGGKKRRRSRRPTRPRRPPSRRRPRRDGPRRRRPRRRRPSARSPSRRPPSRSWPIATLAPAAGGRRARAGPGSRPRLVGHHLVAHGTHHHARRRSPTCPRRPRSPSRSSPPAAGHHARSRRPPPRPRREPAAPRAARARAGRRRRSPAEVATRPT